MIYQRVESRKGKLAASFERNSIVEEGDKTGNGSERDRVAKRENLPVDERATASPSSS